MGGAKRVHTKLQRKKRATILMCPLLNHRGPYSPSGAEVVEDDLISCHCTVDLRALTSLPDQ